MPASYESNPIIFFPHVKKFSSGSKYTFSGKFQTSSESISNVSDAISPSLNEPLIPRIPIGVLKVKAPAEFASINIPNVVPTPDKTFVEVKPLIVPCFTGPSVLILALEFKWSDDADGDVVFVKSYVPHKPAVPIFVLNFNFAPYTVVGVPIYNILLLLNFVGS